MDIDYSLPTANHSSFALAVKTPFLYGKRHLTYFGMNLHLGKHLGISILDWKQSLKHLFLGAVEMIPGVGHVVAAIDRKINHRDIRVIRLRSTDPFEMGREQGILLRSEIQTLVTKLLMVFRQRMLLQGKDPLVQAKELAAHIPADYLRELEGIASGTEIPLDDLLIANTIMDTMSLFGCSVYAISKDVQDGSTVRSYATNYFSSLGQWLNVPDVDQSFRRYNDLEAHSSDTSVESMKAALLKVNYYDTIQSIVFDKQDIHIATAGEFAANTTYTHIKGGELFDNSINHTNNKVVTLARNMDWPLPPLGPQTIILVRPAHNGKKATAIVGWPGMLGAFSGVNEQGTSLAITVVPSQRQVGIPGHLLFRQILENAGSIETAKQIVNESTPASAWNLVVAATDDIAKFELDPHRQKQGAAQVMNGG